MFNLNNSCLLAGLLVCLLACQSNKSTSILDGKTLVEIKEDSLGNKYNYKSCAVSAIMYKFKGNSLYKRLRMEGNDWYKVIKVKQYKDSIIYHYHPFYDEKAILTLKLERIDSLSWKFGSDAILVDSLYALKLPTIEEPCTECFTKEECDEWAHQEKLEKLGALHDDLSNTWRGSWQSDYRPYGFEISLYLEQDKITYNGINDLNQSHFSIECWYKEVNNELYLYYSGWHDPDEVHNTEFKLDTTPLLKLYRKDGNLYTTDLQHFKIDSLELYEY